MGEQDFYSRYREWIDQKDELFQRFEFLAEKLESFILKYVLQSNERVALVAGRFYDVLSNCDTVNYDDDGGVEAYAILHFLDRFLRFQQIFLKMLERGLLPMKTLPIDALDVGTGPAPALFALSDTYSSLNHFATEVSKESIGSPVLRSDYVESSTRFRDWLHAFTEHANSREADQLTPLQSRLWSVPYHSGSFSDFNGLDFESLRNSYFKSLIDDYAEDFEMDEMVPPPRDFIIRNMIGPEWKNAFHFDLIVFSNFLTSNEQVKRFSKELRSAGRALRNNGLILVVGARKGPYPDIYASVESILCERSYVKKRSVSRISEVRLDSNEQEMKYAVKGRHGYVLKRIIRTALEAVQKYHAEAKIAPRALARMRRDSDYQYLYRSRMGCPRIPKAHGFPKALKLAIMLPTPRRNLFRAVAQMIL
jgi:hypothetical protein